MAVLWKSKADTLLNSLGLPRVGGKINFFLAGTSTPTVAYSDDDLETATDVSLTLDSAGRPQVNIYLAAYDYKIVVTNTDGTDSKTIDVVHGGPVTVAGYATTLAGAKALAGATDAIPDGFTITVAGRASIDDGYQGQFAYKASDTTTTFTTVNDGTGFVDNQNRRWFRLYSGAINALWFGTMASASATLGYFNTALGSGYYSSAISGARVGEIPAGFWETTDTWDIPVHAQIRCVPGATVIRPASGVAIAVTATGGGQNVSGLTIIGTNTSGKIGIQLGNTSQLVQARFTDCIVTGFLGATAFGWDVQECISCTFDNCVGDGNYRNWMFRVSLTSSGPSVNCTFIAPVGKSATETGFYGTGIVHAFFLKPWVENNGGYGFYFNSDTAIQDITVMDMHSETNQLSTTTAGGARNLLYNHVFRVKRGMEIVGGEIESGVDSARAFDLSHCVDFLIDHPDINAGTVESNQIKFDANSKGIIANWPVTSNGAARFCCDFSTVADGSIVITGEVRATTVAAVGSASGYGAGALALVTNETGGAVLAFSDGTNFRRVTDRAVVS